MLYNNLRPFSLDGVKLNEGFVADEDTTIYNPGLTLLTSSEKERLVNAIVDNRQIGLSTQHWSENNEYAFDFLKQKLDRKSILLLWAGRGKKRLCAAHIIHRRLDIFSEIYMNSLHHPLIIFPNLLSTLPNR